MNIHIRIISGIIYEVAITIGVCKAPHIPVQVIQKELHELQKELKNGTEKDDY